jgi:Tfp pilus assembly protein PilF
MIDQRTGKPVTCSSADAHKEYETAVDLILGSETGAAEHLDRALALDPHYALAAVARYLLARDAKEPNADQFKARAIESSRAASDWERAHVETLVALLEDPYRALASTEAYIKGNPGDLLIISQLCGYLIFYGGPTKLTRVLDILESVHDQLKDDWAYLSRLGFAASEAGDVGRGRALVERALAIRPQALYSIHALAHVLHDAGEAAESARQLARWLDEHGQGARGGQLYGHVQWHLALSEWQLGKRDEASARYQAYSAPRTTTCGPVLTLADCGGFLLRDYLATGRTTPLAGEVEDHIRQFAGMLAHPFIALHVAGLYASAGDIDGLRNCRKKIEEASPGSNRDTSLALVDSLIDLSEHRYASAANRLQTLDRDTRIGVGGSRVERILIDLVEQRAMAQGRQLNA